MCFPLIREWVCFRFFFIVAYVCFLSGEGMDLLQTLMCASLQASHDSINCVSYFAEVQQNEE